MLMTGICVYVCGWVCGWVDGCVRVKERARESIFLFVSVHALTYTRSNKGTLHHSLHADSLILLVLLPADCHCSLQAGLTSPFHHLLVHEVTPGPPDKLAVSQLAGPCFNASCFDSPDCREMVI